MPGRSGFQLHAFIVQGVNLALELIDNKDLGSLGRLFTLCINEEKDLSE